MKLVIQETNGEEILHLQMIFFYAGSSSTTGDNVNDEGNYAEKTITGITARKSEQVD